jgi:hypothetical protein
VVILCLASMLYLLVSLLLGLFISGKTRNQFQASQVALLASFMPAMMLSGFVFDLRNVPAGHPGHQPTAARHAFHGQLIKTLFLAGDHWPTILRSVAILSLYAVVLGRSPHSARCARHWTDAMTSFIATLAQIGALVRKELLALVKEPASRAILIVPALLQALLFGYGATYDLTHVPYAVLDQSRSAASTELLARLDGTGVFVRAATLTSPRQIAEMVDAEKALLVLSIPPDFAARAGRWPARAPAAHPGRAQLLDGGFGRRPRRRHRGRLQCLAAARCPRHSRGTARLVQPQPGVTLEHDAWTDCRAEHVADPAAGGAVGGARTRARHLRPVAGDAAHADADPDRQGAAGDPDRTACSPPSSS